jgi:signal transduction histidine kinase
MGRVQLASVIQNSIAATLPAAQDKGISIKTEIERDLPDVHGDRDRLIQALTNLLSNAIKFTNEGEVRIDAWRLQPGDDVLPLGTRQPEKELELPATEPLLCISITDTGVGISEDELSLVFEQFRQAGEQNSDTRQAGTGLGLPISKEIIEHHGGQIWVESRPGEGSRFIFLLRPM